MASHEMPSADGAEAGEIAPLLSDVEAPSTTDLPPPPPPQMSIFSISRSHSRNRNPKENLSKASDTEDSIFNQFFSWAWDGSKFSGMICMALASTIYCIMEYLANAFLVEPLPLFEVVFTRCTIMLIPSFMWSRRTGQPVLGPMNTRAILISRALVGYLSLVCFIYSLQKLPLHYAIAVNLATPVVASLASRLLLEEKSSLLEIGGLTVSFVGILFVYQPLSATQGAFMESQQKITVSESGNTSTIGPLLVGVLSSLTGGVTYCLIKLGAKATDQPVLTVFVFGAIACPLSAICGFFFEKFIPLDLHTFIVTAILGLLAFFAEVLIARGLQLENIGKATNILYLKVLITQLSSMAFFEAAPLFPRLLGCLLLMISICSTIYIGPSKEIS